MHSLRLASRRSRALSGLLATVGAVALVLTALVVGITGYLDFSATANTRALLATVAPTASSIRVETTLADDPKAQSEAADVLLGHQFSGLPVAVTRTLTDFPLPGTLADEPLELPDGSDARITVSSDPTLDTNATLVAGKWLGKANGDGSTASPISGVLQADAAKQLGLTVGEVLAVGIGSDAKSIAIVGTWLPKDANDSRWFADPGVATGNAVPAGDGTQSFGPLMVDQAVLPTIGPVPSVGWTIALDAQRTTPAQLEQFAVVAASLRQQLIDDGTIGKGDILVDGTVAQTATAVHDNLESVRGITPVGVLLVALIGLIALVQLARLLSLARRAENALLRSRGASAQWLTTAGVVEAAVVAILGCGIGFAVAGGALFALFGSAALPFAPWEFAGLAAFAVLVIFGTTAFLDSIRLAKRDAIDDSGRTRAAATLGITVLAIAAAGVAVWQSLLYGSPLITDAAGRSSVNPLAVVAPTLALIAVALVLLVIFGPLTSTWQRIAAARPQLQPSYSARQVARGLGSYAVAVLVVSLAVGGLVVASGFSGTWRALSERNAELVTGADARITLTTSDFPQAGSTPVTGAEFLTVPGVTDAAPVLSTPISIGDNESGQLTAIPHDAISSVVTDAGGALDPKTLAHGLGKSNIHGIQLPADSTALSLTLTVTRGPNPGAVSGSTSSSWVQAGLWLRNSSGAVITTTFPRIDVASLGNGDSLTNDVRFELPGGDDTWTLVAIDYAVHASSGYFNTSFSNFEATTASGSRHVALDTTTWGMPLLVSYGSTSETGKDGLSVGLPAAGGATSSLRFMEQNAETNGVTTPGLTGNTFYRAEPLPLIVSKELATHYDVGRGDPFEFRFAGSGLTISGKVAAVVPLLPGTQSPNAVLVDLNALTAYVLQVSAIVPSPNQVWLATNGPVSLGSALPKGATVITPASSLDTRFATPSTLALWAAAIGCLLLAVISLGAVTLTVARARRGEVAVLRAVGISARQQSQSRLAELSAVILISVVFGILGGLAVSALTVPNLARSAVQDVPDGLPASLTFAVTTGGALLLGSLVVLLGIAAFSAARVRSVALDTSERLETR